MTTITEQPDTNRLAYLVRQEGGTERVVCTTCSRQTVNGIDTFVFRNSMMEILMKPSCFVTEDLRYEARNTATQAVSALKTLESFCEIIGTPLEAFGIEQARAYLQFLRGTLGEGITYRFELITQRSEETVGAYLKHIRRYARWLGISNSPFLQPKRSISSRPIIDEGAVDAHRLKADVAKPKEAPRYISTDDYKRIIAVIDEGWTLEERCIVRLMYEHGLRIGEVLGLTTEDLEWTSTREGIHRFAVVLRNRRSDRADQCAKTLMRVMDAKQYASTDYGKRNVGFQKVHISESLFMQMAEYAEDVFPDDVGADCPCLADSVKGDEGNRYLFVNTAGRPLSSNLWNKRLRRIMSDADVQVDKEVRKTNLNHRFRHGYAMFLTHEARLGGRPLDDYAVMTLMRHRSIASTEVYQRPTQEDVARMQGEIIGSFEEEIYGDKKA